MASSSAGPSKRPRQESLSHFQSDVLNDEEFSMLIENGGFCLIETRPGFASGRSRGEEITNNPKPTLFIPVESDPTF